LYSLRQGETAAFQGGSYARHGEQCTMVVSHRWALAFPFLFVFLWSTGFIGAKLGLPYAEPATFLCLRFIFVLALLVPLCILGSAPWPASRREAGHMAVAGILVQAGYLIGMFYAMYLGLPAGVSALIASLQPILTALLSARMLGEQTSRRQWLGLALGVAGVVLVVHEKLAFEGASPASVLFCAFGLVCFTLGALWQKRYCPKVDPRTGTVIQFGASFVVLAPVALLAESMQVKWTGEFVFALAYLVLVLSLGAIFLLFWLIRHGSATEVASLLYLMPPCTALVAWPLFGETYTLYSAAGMAIAVAAVWLVTKSDARRDDRLPA
jgi:drug/metabolite transporter (DMT)-like permease